jgi:hypothetical protein
VVQAVGRSLQRPFELLIFEPMCLNLCIFSALLLGILYLFFGAFPLVFGTSHGFNTWQVGLSFTGILVGMIAGILTDPVWSRIRTSLVRKLEAETGVPGASEPEFRLPPAIMGAFLVPAGIFMFGWSTYPWVHWIVPIVGSAIFAIGYVLTCSIHSSLLLSRIQIASPLFHDTGLKKEKDGMRERCESMATTSSAMFALAVHVMPSLLGHSGNLLQLQASAYLAR